MKSSPLFALLLLLSSASSSKLPSATDDDYALDTEGNPIRSGGTYNIQPAIWPGGGLGLAATGNDTCPLTVIQLPYSFPFFNGLPVRLSSPYETQYLPADSNTNISFTVMPPCASSAQWTMAEGQERDRYVKITDDTATVVNGWFQIHKINLVFHKLVFCPLSGDSCEDLGISRDDNQISRLVITHDQHWTVVFQKADELSSA